jgi:diguanylate cyclase
MGRTWVRGTRSNALRLLACALLSIVPVVVLGVVMNGTYRTEARHRGLAEGRSEAGLVARTAIEPLLEGHDLSSSLTTGEEARLQREVGQAVADREVLRLRLRDLGGHVVFSSDAAGNRSPVDDEALDASSGAVVARLTTLNADDHSNDPNDPAVVEVYEQLRAGQPEHPVGVLEVYLPYAPIRADIAAGLNGLHHDLIDGLAVLYVVLLAISFATSRGLRRQVKANAFLATHDALTDLPNRMLFQQRAHDAVATATEQHPVAIGVVDLDRFKDVNDSLGHNSGDQLLIALAQRLAAEVRPGDTIARLGGDEFGLILRGATDPMASFSGLRDTIESEVEVSGLPLSIGASIGFVVAPGDGTAADELIQRADVAMYVAKAEHEGVVRYSTIHDQHDAANLTLVGELRRAIDANELVLHFQPKISVGDRQVEAVESLVRWQHPVHGLLGPDRFVPLAEQTDLIEKLTDWVLASSLDELNELARIAPDVSVAVNVSARSLNRADFPERVLQALADHHASPHRLILEITETALLTNPVKAARALAQLSHSGIRISIDDFGKGQTSLGYLPTLPIHELKIDKDFVTDMLEDASHAAIVRSVIDLGHNLGLRVVAEGVETAAALQELRMAGCDVAQGFLIARPMPPDHLRAWIAKSIESTRGTGALASLAASRS